MATTINAGRVRFVSRGTYNNSTQYYLFDLVDYNGSSYIAKENTLGNLPTNTQYWQLIAEKGNTGSTGQTGPTGATGNGIASITKTGTSGLVDTYTITYTNGNTTTFTVTNGEDGEVTQAQFDDLQQRVEDAENNQLTYTPTPATSHYLQDSADSRFRKFIPIGRSVQESTTGKNKFSSELELGSIDNSTGLPSSSTVDTCLRTKDYISVQPSTTYTIKNNKGYYTFLYFYQEDKTYISYSRNTTDTITFTTDSNTYFIKLRTSSDRNENDITAKYMLNTGSTSEPYEPYTGGEPAPNPIYPFPIKNTGDNVNLFDGNEINYTKGDSFNGNLVTDTNSRWYGRLDLDTLKLPLTISTYINCTTDNWNDTNIRLDFFDENNSKITTITGTSATSNNTRSVFVLSENIIPSGAKYITIKLRIQNSGYTEKTKIEQGTKATPYSPYGCGNVNEKVQNKNLLNVNTVVKGNLSSTGEISTGGITDFSVVDGKVSFKTSTAYRGFSSDFIECKENTNYSISFKKFPTDITSYIDACYYDKNKNFIVRRSIALSPANARYMKISIYTATTNTLLSFSDIQLERGSTATDYVPHSEQNISFPLAEGQKFMEGSYPDDDEKVHHKRKEVVFDGSDDEDWRDYGSSQRFYVSLADFTGPDNNIKPNILCDKLITVSRNNAGGSKDNYISSAGVNTHNIIIRINSEIDTVAKIKAFLQDNPIKVQYELSEEHTEDFIEEQKTAWQEWKKARTYKNVTHISSEDETPANVELEYVRDLETVINNLSN